MKPVVPETMQQEIYTLTNEQGERIIYAAGSDPQTLDLPLNQGSYILTWIDPVNGRVIKTEDKIQGGKTYSLKSPANGNVVLWMKME